MEDHLKYIEEINALKKTIKTLNKQHRSVIDLQIKEKENQIQNLENEVKLLKMYKYNGYECEEFENENDGKETRKHTKECFGLDNHDVISLGVAKYYLGKENQKFDNEVKLLKMKTNEDLEREISIFEKECCYFDSHDIISLGVARYYLGKQL